MYKGVDILQYLSRSPHKFTCKTQLFEMMPVVLGF